MPPLLELPSDLLPVQDVLGAAMARVEKRFDAQLWSDLPPVRRLCQHVERYRGKMLRPMLVFLSAMAAGEDDGDPAGWTPGDDLVSLAAVCEMIHMATLVHDDVLDEADTRRRGSTVNRLHGNECAVILGDYLFSAAYHLCSSISGEAGRQAALLIGKTGMTLCAGELLQLHHREDYSIDEETYFEIVRRKTASLIAAACRLGAMHARDGLNGAGGGGAGGGGGESPADRLHEFGLKLGIAFQIQDDLLDLTSSQTVVGKSVGKDVELGKLTLPLIHHLAAAAPLSRGRTLDLLSQPEFRTQAPPVLLEALEQTGSIAHARKTARGLVERAKQELESLADGPGRRFLRAMADAVVDRSF